MNMNNKIALITGSTSGIGRETAIHFASLGAKIVVTGRTPNVIDEVVEDCQRVSPTGHKPLGVVADFNVDDDTRKLVKATIDTYGQLDVLVNNAGIGFISEIDASNLMDVYRSVTDTNVRTPLFLTQLCVPYLEKTKGCIVNVSSVFGLKPNAKWTVYCMSKAALDMMTKCLAIELGRRGIRVNSVNPAYVITDFQRRMGLSTEDGLAFRELNASKCPLGRVGQPSDVAKAIAFLASNDTTPWVSGTQLNIDGASFYV